MCNRIKMLTENRLLTNPSQPASYLPTLLFLSNVFAYFSLIYLFFIACLAPYCKPSNPLITDITSTQRSLLSLLVTYLPYCRTSFSLTFSSQVYYSLSYPYLPTLPRCYLRIVSYPLLIYLTPKKMVSLAC